MRRASLGTIFLIVVIDLMGFGIVMPNLQLYGEHFGISNYLVLTLLGAVYSLFQFIFAPLLGQWSDRIGRRPVLLISQAGTLLGFLMLYSAHYFEGPGQQGIGIAILFGSRILDGISGGNISTATAYIADVTPPEQRARGMGVIGAAFGLGFIFGPLIGGTVGGSARMGLSYVPLVAAAFSLAALLLTYFTLPESHHPGERTEDARRYSIGGLRAALRRPVIAPLMWMSFAYGVAFAGMEQTLSLLIQYRMFPEENRPQSIFEHGGSAASRATGYLFCGIGLIIAVIQGGAIHRLTKRFGGQNLVIVGAVLVAAGLASIGLPVPGWGGWVGLVVGCGILAVGSSLFNPSLQALISRHAGAQEQGAILGANAGLASLARVVGPVLAGVLFQYGAGSQPWPGLPYYVSAAITVAVAGAAITERRRLAPRDITQSETRP